MARIGTFKKNADGKFEGEIKTLTFYTKATLVPVEQSGERGPSLRVFAGVAELGAGWEQTAQHTGQVYHSIKLDDPSFAAPINTALFPSEKNPGTYDLIWNRNKPE
jgi:uncharacterized protein (DUF736 family)